MRNHILKPALTVLFAVVLAAVAHASFYRYNETGSTIRIHYREDVNYYSEVFTGGEGSYTNYGTFDLAPGQSLTMNDYTDTNGGWVYEHFFSIEYVETL